MNGEQQSRAHDDGRRPQACGWAALWLGLLLLVAPRSGAADENPPAFVSHVALTNGRLHLTIQSDIGLTNHVQAIADITQTNWFTLTNLVVTHSPYLVVDATVTNPPAPLRRFYRVVAHPPNGKTAGSNMVLIPAGPFLRGDTFAEGNTNELPTRTLTISAFYADQYEVTKALWDQVVQWATNNGYTFGGTAAGKAPNHPAHSMSWHDAVKWCNARSEMEGRVPAYYTDAAQTVVYRAGTANLSNQFVKWNAGYRLPTEAEWEKAARGGTNGHRFPWSDTNSISHARANYNATGAFSYDASAGSGYHPAYNDGVVPYTSPVGAFATNGFGLYDMAGNVWEWCWDRFEITYYGSAPDTDPHGPDTGPFRVNRGGGWAQSAESARVARRRFFDPAFGDGIIGFRTVLPANDP